jgi:hypothetical protein
MKRVTGFCGGLYPNTRPVKTGLQESDVFRESGRRFPEFI